MRHQHHTRRATVDPLAPIDSPVWVVVRNMCGQILKLTELPPRADQHAALTAAGHAHIGDGWTVDKVGPHSAHFFAMRAGERIMVGIERYPEPQVRR